MLPYAEVVGDPIAHSKSPTLHRFWLGAMGIEADYRAHHIRSHDLQEYLAERRGDPKWRGCNLTAPHKEIMVSFLDELSPCAAAIGAANIAYCQDGRLIGDNSDIEGIAEALPQGSIEGKTVIILGAGGAARAAIYHLVLSGASEIRLLARRPEAASKLASAGTGSCPVRVFAMDEVSNIKGADLLVNASPLGMAQAPMPDSLIQSLATLDAGGLVFDMVYEPLETPLLIAARRCSLTAVDGLTMLIGQARRSFHLFFGEEPPPTLDAELRSHLSPSPIFRPIVLVGLPGAGKTTLGAALAERLNLLFFDSDREIERRTGVTIAEYFEHYGEAAFRIVEREVVGELIAASEAVIALGGGAFADPRTRAEVKKCCASIWLDAPIETIHARLESSADRPLVRGEERLQMLQSLAAAREGSYAKADIRVSSTSLAETIEEILLALLKRSNPSQ